MSDGETNGSRANKLIMAVLASVVATAITFGGVKLNDAQDLPVGSAGDDVGTNNRPLGAGIGGAAGILVREAPPGLVLTGDEGVAFTDHINVHDLA